MNWTKIPTNLLISRTPDNELVAIVKYQLLWADLEYQPTDEIALRYMSNKQLASVKQYLNDIETQVVSDINLTVNHRGGQKAYYKKKQSLTQNYDNQYNNQCDSQCDNHADVADKIREDKIRIECTPKPPFNKFTPPTLQEVIDYAAEQTQWRGVGGFRCPRSVAEEFWAHYDSQGWKKSNDSATPVTNWQSALRLWAKKQPQFEKTQPDLPV